MGVWGAGIYSSDYAADLRSMIRAITRLPFDGNRLLEILAETESDVSQNPNDEDFTSFWLVAADQFHKRGIETDHLFERAKKIIDSNQDLNMAAELGMTSADLKKRSKILQDLRNKIESPLPVKSRKTFSKPQPFLLEIGSLFIFPTSGNGEPINPYMTAEENECCGWKHEKWGAGLVVSRGRAFGYLAWYQAIKLSQTFPKSKKPTIEKLIKARWQLSSPGTLSRSHLKKMKFEILSSLELSVGSVENLLETTDGLYQAVEDISICNSLTIGDNNESNDLTDLDSLVEP